MSAQDDFRRIKVLGQGFDKKMISEEVLSKNQFFFLGGMAELHKIER